jgi:hypothetical protein
MTERRSLPLLLLLACAHVVLIPVSLTGFFYEPAPYAWHSVAIGICAAQLGLLTVWLNQAGSRGLPLACTLAALTIWGSALAPIVGFRGYVLSAALFMTQLSILTQISELRTRLRGNGRQASDGARFRYQFSLRTLMMAALVICLLLGYPQWLSELSESRLPVFTITASTAVLALILIAMRVLKGVTALLPALLLLFGLAFFVAAAAFNASAWWQMTKRGFAAETVAVLASVVIVQIAGFRLQRSSRQSAKAAATFGPWATPSTSPPTAAP